jgi:peptide/nickel transport system permease protein
MDEIRALRADLRLDQPLPVQFVKYFSRLVRGDLGSSLFFRKHVLEIIATRVEVTLLLAALAQVLAVAVSIPLGVWGAARRGSWVDQSLTVLSLITVSVPSFWLGLMFIIFFSLRMGWFPVTGYGQLAQSAPQKLWFLTLPTIVLGLSQAAAITRMARSSMLEVLAQDYLRTARAKGAAEREVLFVHALRNAMVPLLAVIALSLSALLGGAAIIETVFSLPGIGSLMVDSVGRRDYPVIQALLMLSAATIVVLHLIIDVLYGVLDPRVRYD